jgi:adenosylhomocysteine nucleosidase
MSAIPGELKLLRSRLDATDVVLVESGIGKVNAAVVTTQLILQHKPEVILFTGVAGGLDPDLGVGDVVIGERAIQHDAGVRFDGRLDAHQAGHIPFFNPTHTLGYYPSPALLETAKKALDQVAFSEVLGRLPRSVVGVILTGDQFISSPIERERLHREFGAHAVEMEGAAVAQVADRFDVDCLVVRALSDMAGDDSELDFARFLEQVAVNSAKVVERIVGMLTQ